MAARFLAVGGVLAVIAGGMYGMSLYTSPANLPLDIKNSTASISKAPPQQLAPTLVPTKLGAQKTATTTGTGAPVKTAGEADAPTHNKTQPTQAATQRSNPPPKAAPAGPKSSEAAPPPPKDFASRMARLQNLTQSTRAALERYWNVSAAAFNETLSEGPAWRRAEDDLLDALSVGGRYVMAFLGSSVTAAHDNFFVQGYPSCMERTLAPVMKLGGVELVVRNQGMGGAPCLPSALCVETLAGDDVHFVAWEYDMMMAKGRTTYIELALRNAIALPNRPAFLVIHADAPMHDHHGHKMGNNKGKPLPPMERDPILDAYGEKGFATAVLSTSRAYWGRDREPGFTYADFQGKDKPWGIGGHWHPGPIGHLFRSDVLAWNYLRMLENAAVRLVAMGEGSKSNKPDLKVPPPLKCEKRFCARPPRCMTTYEPRFVRNSLNTAASANSGWELRIAAADLAAFKKNQQRNAGYKDIKYVWMSKFRRESAERAWISIELPEVSASGGMVWVCEPDTGWHYPLGKVPLSKVAEVRLSDAGEGPDAEGWRPAGLVAGGKPASVMGSPKAKTKPGVPLCSQVLLTQAGGPVGDVPPGRYALHVRVAPNASIADGNFVSFSQVIVW